MLILNNSVISAFCELERLALLKGIIHCLDEKAAIPRSVLSEIIYPEALKVVCTQGEEPTNEKWLLLLNHFDLGGYASQRGIHEGEAAVVILSKEHDAVAVLDDFKARQVAREEGVKLTGTIGLLRIGYEECPIPTKGELLQLVEKLKTLHFHLPRDAEEYLLQAEKIREHP